MIFFRSTVLQYDHSCGDRLDRSHYPDVELVPSRTNSQDLQSVRRTDTALDDPVPRKSIIWVLRQCIFGKAVLHSAADMYIT